MSKNTFKEALGEVILWCVDHEIGVLFEGDLDPFFKGDLDGKVIYLDQDMDDEEKLFNLLHLIGHTIQWNSSEELYRLGSVLHSSPDRRTLASLYQYEWEANCMALYILEYLGFKSLKTWLYDLFKEDINYLMQYYKTGKKEKILPEHRVPAVELVPKAIPHFTAQVRKRRDNGIVIKF